MEAPASPKKSKSISDCPILSLPDDILAKIIAFVPIPQWSALELLDFFHAATQIAWRQLRHVNVDRDFVITPKNLDDPSSALVTGESVTLILHMLVERSPFLTSLSGIYLDPEEAELNSNAIESLAQFEHLQSITFGASRRGIPLENVLEFLELTRSRTSLKQLQLYNVVQRLDDRATILDRFASTFANGRDIRSPLKLEKFLFTMFEQSLNIRLNTLDTSRLTDVRFRKASIDPDQLTTLIVRAPNLRRIELCFLTCDDPCNGPQLQANKQLLLALASLENLTALKLDDFGCNNDNRCTDFLHELIEMLKTIGRRGQLRTLALEDGFLRLPTINTDDICATICEYIPYLRSITLHADRISPASVFDIVSMKELEQVQFKSWRTPVMANAIEKVAQLHNLKCLAINTFRDQDADSLKCLADATTLTDLRIGSAAFISADVFEKWSDGFASNLQCLMIDGLGVGGCNRLKTQRGEEGLVRLLQKATHLRVLILDGRITDRSLMAIAQSCPNLESFGVRSASNEISVGCLQEIIDRCAKLKRLGGFRDHIRVRLHFPKYRIIGIVDMEFWDYEFADDEYD